MTHIVHTCLRYPPARGGVETYVHELVERTRNVEENRDVRVLSSGMRTHGPVTELDPELLLDDPPYLQRLHVAPLPGISYPLLEALNYYIGHHRPDILHGYSFWYQPADVAARYAKKHHIPFIFHPMYYENDNRRGWKWQLYKNVMGWKTFAAADIVAVISPHEQELVTRAGFAVKRFELLPPGIDIQEFSAAQPNPFTQRGIQGRVLLCVSRLAKSKGLDDVLSAFAKIKNEFSDVSLVIIGDDFGYKKVLKQHVAEQKLSGQVHFWGNTDRPTLLAAYQHATAFIHASEYEAFGIVVAEAEAAGTPVIARNVAAVPYVVSPEQHDLLFSSESDLLRSLRAVLSNPSRGKTLGQSGKKYVEANFTWDRTITKLLSLYETLSKP